LIYNSADKTMVAWSGDPQKGLQPEDIYVLDLDEFKWAKRVPAAGNAVIPTRAAQQGTYGRFRYVASKNALIVVNDVDQNVYFYKLSSTNGSGSNQSDNNHDVDPVDPANPVDPIDPVDPPNSDHPIGVNDQDEYGADVAQNDSVRVFTETFGQGELPVLTVMEARPSHIAGVAYNNELVSVGVPLQQGTGIQSVGQLALVGASAAQFKALSHYPNGEIRWLQIDFLASVSAGGQTRYELTNSNHPWSGNDLVQQSGGIITVDTGFAQFNIDQDSSSLLTSVVVDGQQQLSDAMYVYSVKNGQQYTSLNDDSTQVTIEKNGPVTAVIRIDGRLQNVQGSGHFWYTARLHFVRDSADVKTQVTMRNASQQELDTQTFDAYGVRMVMANDQPTVSFVTEDGSSWQDSLQASETALIYQGFVDNHPYNQDEISNCYYWTPTVAGVCDSSYIYNYQNSNKGVRVVMAGNTLLQGGNTHSVAYAHVESGGQSISLAQRWMVNHFPASFEIDGNGQIDIGLHSRHSGKHNQQFNWGGHQTREFVIGFQQADPGIMRHKLDWPLVAKADFEYYRHANALLGENKMISYSEEESYFDKYNGFEPDSIKSSSIASFKVKRFTHWRRHYTDYLADIVEFWRGGDPMHLLRVLQSTDFETDSAIAHSDGFDLEHFPNLNVPYAEQRGLNKYDSEHQLTRYLPLIYFMTGSERVRQAIIDYGEDQLFDERSYYFPFPETPYYRAWLRRFENFAWLYGFTRDERYLEEVKSGIDLLVESEASDIQRESRGQDKQRGFLNMSVAEGYEERVIHNFFGVHISGETYYQVLRTLHQAGIKYRTEELEDVVLGHAYFLFREMMRNEDGSTNGLSYTYYLDRENQATGFDNSVYVADRYLQHIYDMFGVDFLDGIDLFAQAFELNYVRGTSVYLPGMMANGQQQALMYNDLFRPAPKHGYQSVDVRVDKNDNGTYTLTWQVPEGAKRYRVKTSKNKPIVDWLGFDKANRSYKLSSDAFVPWFAAQNLENEPEPGVAGSLQTWTVTDLPNDGYWYFSLQYSTRQEEPGIM
nr:hypothetical protein [Gammaproteobacteria bacterium]